MNMAQPNKISIAGNMSVAVSPIHTLGDLIGFGTRFAEISRATPFASVLRLNTAAGDIAASVADGMDEHLAEELADALICIATVAAAHRISSARLFEALNDRTTAVVDAEVHKAIDHMMTSRGFAKD